jgi:predicted PurR-regulated permease PerM
MDQIDLEIFEKRLRRVERLANETIEILITGTSVYAAFQGSAWIGAHLGNVPLAGDWIVIFFAANLILRSLIFRSVYKA